ncbi:hypothetical protein GF337_09890 [candidate division KSB1 bacterium]|nr:hypothetical protein [candidate division KSB1 bacterium]
MAENNNRVYVTKPALPELQEFIPYLREIWESRRLTNNADFHQQFEQELADFLDVSYVSLFANGTLALVTALQVLRITGEVITTPFSFVATTHSLWWNKIKPVFIDIQADTCNLNPNKIEAAITPQTTAILPVHIYGNPCDVEKIQEVADIYGLKVIYDSCHAFGVQVDGESILNFGDISVLSFHATKVFTTFEGGAIVCHDEKTKKRIDYLKNFGFADETSVIAPGINSKMSEFQAALGLLQLKRIDENIEKRKQNVELYRSALEDIPGIDYFNDISKVRHNYSYFPIFVNREEYGKTRDELYEELKRRGIYGRRYFYPLISQFPSYRGLPSASPENLPVAEEIAEKVICLPNYPDLDLCEISRICHIIRGETNQSVKIVDKRESLRLLTPFSLNTAELSRDYYDRLNHILYGNIHLTEKDFSDTILLNPPQLNNQWNALCRVLNKALHRIVTHYFDDSRIRRVYNLSDKLESILRMAQGIEYEVGIYRPDFLIEQDSFTPKICEIGARYPLNGWMVTYYSQLILDQLSENTHLPFSCAFDRTAFIDMLGGKFKKDRLITLVHDKEPGTEIFGFLDILKKRGINYIEAKQDELKVIDGEIFVDGKRCSQFVLEMDRSELPGFEPLVLKTMIQNCYCLNNVRTLILVHDKRVLAVLANYDIMKDYLTKEEYAFLSNFLVPAYSLERKSIRETILERNQNWVFKKNSGGRGVDMYIKNEMESGELNQFLESSQSEYMGQKYVDQERFSVPESVHLVGMLMCFNDHFFGTGIYRGGHSKVVNVDQQRAKLFPAVTRTKVTKNAYELDIESTFTHLE